MSNKITGILIKERNGVPDEQMITEVLKGLRPSFTVFCDFKGRFPSSANILVSLVVKVRYEEDFQLWLLKTKSGSDYLIINDGNMQALSNACNQAYMINFDKKSK